MAVQGLPAWVFFFKCLHGKQLGRHGMDSPAKQILVFLTQAEISATMQEHEIRGKVMRRDADRLPVSQWVLFLAVCGFWGIVPPLYGATPWLHADGNQLRDPGGNVVVLRGVALIDLGFLEDWHGGAFEMIDRLTDKTDPQGNSPGWYPKVLRINVTPPDSVSNWPHPFDPQSNNFYNTLLRPVVDYCKSKDLYVILDWHYIANTYEHVDTTSAFWAYMAPRFAADSHVIFELFNEPINNTFGSETANWLSVRQDMQTWIDIVRTYAPNNLILVAGPNWSQAIGPIADYPVSDPIGGNNIAVVSHIYPGHWRNPSWYQNHITRCRAVYPIVMTEWGFSQSGSPDPGDLLHGTITGYGQPLMDFVESQGISHTAWVASYNWGPPMFYSDWTLRCGEGEMGCFVKDMLYLNRSADQPGGGDTTPPNSPTGLAASVDGQTVLLDWDDSTDADLFGYNVYRSAASGGGYTKLNTWPVDTSDYTDDDTVGGTTYCYVVTAVDDASNESGFSNEASAAPVDPGMGTVLREWWTGLSGAAVSDLTSAAAYPDRPSGSERLTRLEGPTGWGDRYGTRIRGCLHPPAGGSYTFWIAGDDNCELWLSTDGSPANAARIARVPGWTNVQEWEKYPADQQSQPLSLAAGRKYYIEVLQKEHEGGDHVAVAWSGPAITRQVIDGAFLSRWFTGRYGDFTGDGEIDLEDLSAMATLWLSGDCVQTAAMDLNGDCTLNLFELSQLTQNWLQ